MPLQVQDSDKTKLEVRSSVRAQLRLRKIRLGVRCTGVPLQVHKIRREVHSSATAGARQ